jgi:hypothetical protein
MTHVLDIFRLESCGVLWLESAASRECAKARVQELAVRSPGEYLVVNLVTGNQHVIKRDGVEETAHSRKTEVG